MSLESEWERGGGDRTTPLHTREREGERERERERGRLGGTESK